LITNETPNDVKALFSVVCSITFPENLLFSHQEQLRRSETTFLAHSGFPLLLSDTTRAMLLVQPALLSTFNDLIISNINEPQTPYFLSEYFAVIEHLHSKQTIQIPSLFFERFLIFDPSIPLLNDDEEPSPINTLRNITLNNLF
jgi:hypothetical protein